MLTATMYHEAMLLGTTDSDTIGMLVIIILVLLAALILDVVIEIKHMHERPPKDRR